MRLQSARWKTYDDGRTVRLNGDIDCWRNPNNRMGAKHKSKHSFCPVGRR